MQFREPGARGFCGGNKVREMPWAKAEAGVRGAGGIQGWMPGVA